MRRAHPLRALARPGRRRRARRPRASHDRRARLRSARRRRRLGTHSGERHRRPPRDHDHLRRDARAAQLRRPSPATSPASPIPPRPNFHHYLTTAQFAQSLRRVRVERRRGAQLLPRLRAARRRAQRGPTRVARARYDDADRARLPTRRVETLRDANGALGAQLASQGNGARRRSPTTSPASRGLSSVVQPSTQPGAFARESTPRFPRRVRTTAARCRRHRTPTAATRPSSSRSSTV